MTNAIAQIVAQNDVAQNVAAEDKKAAAAKPARTKRAAPKKEEKAAQTTAPAKTVAAAAAAVFPVSFMLNPSIRPGAGSYLFSHTEAVLQVLDMYNGKAYAVEVLDALMGSTAIKYHTSKGRFLEGKKGLTLSSDGKKHFAKRGTAGNKERFVAQDVEAYKSILTTGQMDGRMVKNQAMIKAFAPSATK
jgi:hypothetical protein